MSKKKVKLVERKLGREQAAGQIIFDEKLIEIDPRQIEKEYLGTCIHEAIHFTWPQFTEEVLRAEKKMSDILWRLGYRRVKGLCATEKRAKD
jgi:hypothetical protein